MNHSYSARKPSTYRLVKLAAFFIIALVAYCTGSGKLSEAVKAIAPRPSVPAAAPAEERAASPSARARQDFSTFRDGATVQGSGTVKRVLTDDTQGTRHQKFILSDDNGRTVLVAHNIDIAPRIPALKEGDTVDFCGEFRANAQGGVIHWTHRDPARKHRGGWLRCNGRTYQ